MGLVRASRKIESAVGGDAVNEFDWASDIEERERASILTRRPRLHLGGDDRTVAAGDCIDCGAEIPTERLSAKPDAKRCVECEEFAQEAREEFERRGKR
jgi:RNA polymerase-binding transcription factor DksA